jgi:hypothetical protein
MMTADIAAELEAHGVAVVSVYPGLLRTLAADPDALVQKCGFAESTVSSSFSDTHE